MDFLNSLLNNIDESVIITDPAGRVLLLNEPAFVQNNSLEGCYPLAVGEVYRDPGSAKRSKSSVNLIQGLCASKQSVKSFVECRNKQGATVYLDLNFVPILNEDHQVTHIYLFSRDITPQKVYERKLATQAINISNLIEEASAVIIGVDTLGYITDWNAHCSVITGFAKEEVLARKISEFLLLEQNDLDQPATETGEITIRTKSGTPIILYLSRTPRRTGAGEIIGYTFVGQDITELTGYRKELEQKVVERTRQVQEALENERKAVDAKSRFVSMTSHELRTPLSTIQFASDYISKYHTRISESDLQERLETINRQVGHMEQLLEDLLSYSRIESGSSGIKPSSIRLVKFLQNCAEEAMNHNARSHEVIMDFRHLPGTFVQDEQLLRKVIVNLLTNAIKYSPGKESVEFTVRQGMNDLIVCVRDQGIGITPEDQCMIFEPFMRADGVTHIKGTGLGLSIVKKSLELMGGNISVESQAGLGTAFTVIIPEIIAASEKS